MYTLEINAGGNAAEHMQQLGAAEDRVAERTKRVDDAIRTYAASNDKLAGKLLEVEKTEIRLDQLREQHRMQTERLAAAQSKLAAGTDQVSAGMVRTTSSTMAASAAMQEFEGRMPTRAAARFLGSIQGIGPALQAAFPIIGAVALVEVMGRAVEGAKHLYDHFVLLKDAQAELTRGARELADTYEQSAAKVTRYLVQTLRDQGKFQEAARVEIRGAASATIKLPDYDRDKLESTLGFGGLESYQLNYVKNAYAPIIPADIGGRISQIRNRMHTLDLDLENYGAGGPVRINAASETQTRLEKQAYELLLPVLGQKQIEFNADQSNIQAGADKRDADKAKEAAAKIAAELRAEQKALDSYTKSTSEKALTSPIARAILAAQYEIGQHPTLAGDFAAVATRSLATAAREESERISKGVVNGLDGQTERDSRFFDQQLKATIRNEQAELTPLRRGLTASYERDLRNAQNGERRSMSLARVNAQLSGTSQRDQIDGEASNRIRFANQEYDLQLKINSVKLEGAEKELADAAALDQKNEKIFEAQMQREQAILEMVLRVKQEFERNTVGLVHAAASGHLGGFVKGRLESLGDEVLGKAAGKLFEVILAKARPKTISIRDVIGGAAKDDPVIAAHDRVVAADDRVVAAIDRLIATWVAGNPNLGTPGSIGFPNGSGGPGIPSTASSTIMYGFPPGGGGIGRPFTGGQLLAEGAAGAGLLYSGIHSGGTRGTLEAAGGGAMMAGAALAGLSALKVLAPALAAAGPIGAAVGAGLEIASLIFGPSPAARQSQISNTLAFHRYIDPVAMHASMSTYGGFADYDRFGGIRGSDLSPFPMTQPGYFDASHNIVPGRTLNQFGGGPAVHVTVNALDARSVLDRHQDIGDAIVRALDSGHTGLQEKLRNN